jgi:hypothetical protein
MKTINNEIISTTKTLVLLNLDEKNAAVANLKANSKERQSDEELESWVRGLTGSLHTDQG